MAGAEGGVLGLNRWQEQQMVLAGEAGRGNDGPPACPPFLGADAGQPPCPSLTPPWPPHFTARGRLWVRA